MQDHGSKYFARRHPPPTLVMGSVPILTIFSEKRLSEKR